jgi:hypothetical protein
MEANNDRIPHQESGFIAAQCPDGPFKVGQTHCRADCRALERADIMTE